MSLRMKSTTYEVRVVLLSESAPNSNIFDCRVSSSRHAQVRYSVHVDTHGGTLNGKYPSSCNCPAGATHHHCRHQDATIEQVKAFKQQRWAANQRRISAYQSDPRWGGDAA